MLLKYSHPAFGDIKQGFCPIVPSLIQPPYAKRHIVQVGPLIFSKGLFSKQREGGSKDLLLQLLFMAVLFQATTVLKAKRTGHSTISEPPPRSPLMLTPTKHVKIVTQFHVVWKPANLSTVHPKQCQFCVPTVQLVYQENLLIFST